VQVQVSSAPDASARAKIKKTRECRLQYPRKLRLELVGVHYVAESEVGPDCHWLLLPPPLRSDFSVSLSLSSSTHCAALIECVHIHHKTATATGLAPDRERTETALAVPSRPKRGTDAVAVNNQRNGLIEVG